jgi:hypothetical protein
VSAFFLNSPTICNKYQINNTVMFNNLLCRFWQVIYWVKKDQHSLESCVELFCNFVVFVLINWLYRLLKKMVYHTASVNCFLLKTVTFTCTLHQIMHTTYSNNSLDSPWIEATWSQRGTAVQNQDKNNKELFIIQPFLFNMGIHTIFIYWLTIMSTRVETVITVSCMHDLM